jgi:hypothetical protein
MGAKWERGDICGVINTSREVKVPGYLKLLGMFLLLGIGGGAFFMIAEVEAGIPAKKRVEKVDTLGGYSIGQRVDITKMAIDESGPPYVPVTLGGAVGRLRFHMCRGEVRELSWNVMFGNGQYARHSNITPDDNPREAALNLHGKLQQGFIQQNWLPSEWKRVFRTNLRIQIMEKPGHWARNLESNCKAGCAGVGPKVWGVLVKTGNPFPC